jgi:preprotein translocase subunit SecA
VIPGPPSFWFPLKEDLLRIFGGDRIKNMMNMLKIPEDEPIEARILSRSLEEAQSKIEGMNFDARKHILDYDDVLNKHREVIYRKRREILERARNNQLKEQILEMILAAGFSNQDYEKKEKEVGEKNMRQIEKIISLRVLYMLGWIIWKKLEHLRIL